MTENELKHAVLAIAKRNGWLVYHVPMSTVRGSQGRGYPDLTLARDGRVLFMELKQQYGKLTDTQRAWGSALPPGSWVVARPTDVATVERLLA